MLVCHFWLFLRVTSSFPSQRESNKQSHYNDVIMNVMASQITGVSMVCSTVCSAPNQRKLQRSASLAFVRRIHQWPMNSPHNGPVMLKMFPFDNVIMRYYAMMSSWYEEYLNRMLYLSWLIFNLSCLGAMKFILGKPIQYVNHGDIDGYQTWRCLDSLHHLTILRPGFPFY